MPVSKKVFPKYSNEQYLDGLKHLVLSTKKPSTTLISVVSDSISKIVDAESHAIVRRADARVARAQEKLYNKEHAKE